MMKVLIAYDGSPGAEAAVEEVAGRPWPRGSEIRLVTVVERPLAVPPPNGIEIYGPIFERMRVSLREDAYQRVQNALKKLGRVQEAQTSYELRDGNVKEALLSAVREWSADLVIAGSRGVSGLARLVLGSVSHALVTHAPCSVEIVKTSPPA
jgi:nucleotide-binding universal stress UspA family protein